MVTITDPGSCSVPPPCELTSANLTDVVCNDNSSPTDPADDFITFSLNPAGMNFGATYMVSLSSGTLNMNSGTYGSPTTFQLQNGSAGGGNVDITITDVDDPNCTVMVTLTDPGFCSFDDPAVCELTTAGLNNVICNDGGTVSDPADDFITFTLDPMGTTPDATYTLSVSGGFTPDPVGGTYGSPTTFTLPAGTAGSGHFTLSITDSGDLPV